MWMTKLVDCELIEVWQSSTRRNLTKFIPKVSIKLVAFQYRLKNVLDSQCMSNYNSGGGAGNALNHSSCTLQFSLFGSGDAC